MIGSTTLGTLSITGLGATYQEKAIEITETKTTSALVITISATVNSVYCDKFIISYEEGGSTPDPTLEESNLALTGAPIALNFDLYNNSSAQVINYTTSSTGAVTIEDNDYATFVVNETAKTITVTPTAVTPSAQTITVSQAADETYAAGSKTFTITIDDSTPIPTHTATFSVNGVTSTDNVEEGAAITFPADPANQEGKVFCGWTTSTITGTTNEAPTMVTSATMGNADVTYYAVFANKIAGTMEEVTDVLTNANTINSTSNSYSNWTTSDTSLAAVYKGNSGGDHSSIQLRSNNNNSGIVTTTSGGKATKITVEWNSNTGSDRVLNIYGKGSAYESPADLYSGDPIGTIGRNSTSFTLPYNYAFIGIRSNSGALYLDKVSITWSNGGTPDSYSDYCTTVAADTRDEAGISFANETVTKGIHDTYTGEVLNNPNSLTVSYTSSDEDVATVNAATGAVTIVSSGETIITASFTGNEDYKAGNASYTLTVKGEASILVVDDNVVYGSTYTVDDSVIEGGNITVTSSNTAVATVSGLTITPVAVGTTTITVATAENATYLAGSETFELTVTAPEGKTTAAAATETVFEETFADCNGTGGNSEGFATAGSTVISNPDNYSDIDGWTLENGYPADACVKFGGSSKKGSANSPDITVESGKTYTLTFKAAPWNEEADKTMTISVSGGTINSEVSVTTSNMTIGQWNEFEYDIVANSTTLSLGFTCSANRFFLDDVKVTTAGDPLSVTLNATTGYATYCSEYPLDFSDDSEFSAWEITNIEGTTITFNQITGSVKGGTGLFLMGTPGATVTLTSAASTTELGDNLLIGTLAPTYVEEGAAYGLSGNQFVQSSYAGTIQTGKAYIPADVVPTEVKSFTFKFQNPATGITETRTATREEVEGIFNLAGQRMSKMQKGINIVNGKKVLVK